MGRVALLTGKKNDIEGVKFGKNSTVEGTRGGPESMGEWTGNYRSTGEAQGLVLESLF